MMQGAGVQDITVLGFRRRGHQVVGFSDLEMLDIGEVSAGRIVTRVFVLNKAMFRTFHLRSDLAGANVILARNLDLLAVAVFARRFCHSDARLVYECLDLHPSLTSRSFPSKALRRVEAYLAQKCDLLIVSSPAFLTNHFDHFEVVPSVEIVENKILWTEFKDTTDVSRRSDWQVGDVVRIGWFGLIRCKRSLQILSNLCDSMPDAVTVVVRGVPNDDLIEALNRAAEKPNFQFDGAYDRSSDLRSMYSDVHFAWALDFYEADGNSKWLLPNRIYEAGAFKCILLAQQGVETGRWLADRNLGFCLDEPIESNLITFLKDLSHQQMIDLQRESNQAPQEHFVLSERDCLSVTRSIVGIR
jgi:succinoglycan biosynthesis protein ExoL